MLACVCVCVMCALCVGAPHTATAHLASDEAGPPFDAASNYTHWKNVLCGYSWDMRACVCVCVMGEL